MKHHSVEDDQVLWSNIEWRSFEANGRSFPHAALMVDAQVQDSKVPALMQLDLGNDPTVLYHYSNLAFGIKANFLHLVSGTIANRRFRNESFRFIETGGRPSPASGPILLGSLGSSFFKDRVLLLDFVKQRVAILGKGFQLPHALERGFEYLPVTHNRYGNLLVTATINGRAEHDVVFDTGSSMFAMVTGHRNWIEWTNRRDDDARNSIIRANSWGRTAVLIGAPLIGSLCISAEPAIVPSSFSNRRDCRISALKRLLPWAPPSSATSCSTVNSPSWWTLLGGVSAFLGDRSGLIEN